MQSNPPQGNNGKTRGAPRRRGVPRGKGGPRGRGGPRPYSSHKTPPLRKIIIENSPHRPPPPESCYESKARWKECIENQLIPKGTAFKTHHSRHNGERQVAERGNDYEGTEIDPPLRRQHVERGPSHSQAK